MECVIETKANSILDFIHGLRGELQVTLKKEPGPPGCMTAEAARTKLVVCDRGRTPGRGTRMTRSMHASWPTGVHEQAQLGLSRRSRRPHAEGISTQLSDHQQRSRTSHEPGEAIYRSWVFLVPASSLCAGHRADWLAKITEVGVLRRPSFTTNNSMP